MAVFSIVISRIPACSFGLALLATTLASAQAKPPDVSREFTATEYDAFNAVLATSAPNATAARLDKAYVPLYPISRAMSGKTGECLLQFTVDTRGVVSRIEREREDDRKMCDHAVIALRHWRFTPATVDGVPVETRHRVPITYALGP